jgi:hypothetical protein
VEAPKAGLLTRIAVIGSSASAGWNTQIQFAEALEAQILVEHQPIVSFADEAFFVEPGSIGEAQVERARKHAPSLVVAVDFLFWFGYGEVDDESERLENLELGLEVLDTLDCALLISRFPDMTPAVGKMLLPAQMPKLDTLAKLNARVDEWAGARGRTAFVPMGEMLTQLRGGEELRIGGLSFKGAESKRRLMQADELHPTAEGLGVLARLCTDVLRAEPFAVPDAAFREELAPILTELRELDQSRAAKLLEQGLEPKRRADRKR